ncbi:hypothetical protein [Peribacillus sp. NPDC097295]|uniref:hypothetical protein n=1 Tax=Peribacillus sp. NPDC097295 TaxID=3364402 RepID=UPI00382B1619
MKKVILEILINGHGNIIYQPGPLIEKRLNSIEMKSQKFFTLLESGITTGNELAKAFYKGEYRNEFPLVMSEIIGHLDYVDYKGKINKHYRKNVVLYTAR